MALREPVPGALAGGRSGRAREPDPLALSDAALDTALSTGQTQEIRF